MYFRIRLDVVIGGAWDLHATARFVVHELGKLGIFEEVQPRHVAAEGAPAMAA